jgi:hypothetical protein
MVTEAATRPAPDWGDDIMPPPPAPATIEEIAAWAEACAARGAGAGLEPEPELPPLPEPGTPERGRFDAEQARMVAGLLRVARMRPALCPARPFAGCFCGQCGAQGWRRSAGGWRCTGCSPPA